MRENRVRGSRELERFPGIGAPGAEKILLFSGPSRSWPWNPIASGSWCGSAMWRMQSNYAGTYRSVQYALADQLPDDCAWLIRTHQLPRQHGIEFCKRIPPACTACPLNSRCGYACHGWRR